MDGKEVIGMKITEIYEYNASNHSRVNKVLYMSNINKLENKVVFRINVSDIIIVNEDHLYR